MTSLRQIKDRIHSVKATGQLTASMKVVALARLKKMHQAFLKTENYSLEMTRMVRRLFRSVSERAQETAAEATPVQLPSILTGRKEEQVYLVCMMTSDDGLSGISNAQVVEKACDVIMYLEGQGKQVKTLCMGTKGADILRRLYRRRPTYAFSRKARKNETLFADAERMSLLLQNAFDRHLFDVCLFVYNRFKTIVAQKPTIEQFIPNRLFAPDNPWQFLIDKKVPDYIKKDALGQEHLAVSDTRFLKAFGGIGLLRQTRDIDAELTTEATRLPWLYDYDPADDTLLKNVLPQYLSAYLYRILMEVDVADNAARLIAMDNSTRNANQMLSMLNKQYASTRQALITTDLVERAGARIEEEKES